MAARKSPRYLGGAETLNPQASADDQFELDEADVWSTDEIIVLPETKKQGYYQPRPARNPARKSGAGADHLPVGPKSLPVNIPEWSKILGGEYGRRAEEEEEEGDDQIPPHEYLARNRGASFSVHEGVGRTLKGRDLSRVRNAILKRIGFED